MKERPIIFSDESVRAIFEGRKTQTRRVAKLYPSAEGKRFAVFPPEEIIQFDDGTFNYLSTGALSGPYSCSYGVPGDRLWVKESFWYSWCQESTLRYARLGENLFVANFKDKTTSDSCFSLPSDTSEKWRSPLFMPRKVSRMTLEIVDVRVERLFDISEEDAKAEGYDHSRNFCIQFRILNKLTMDVNPWVWAIEFKKT